MSNNRQKFQGLLSRLFQFESADLDFGIYRIMNHKRDVIEKFIEKDLLDAISAELAKGALAQESKIAQEIQEVVEQIKQTLGEEALNGDGSLAEQYQDTPLGKRYMELKAEVGGVKSQPALEAMIFNHLYTFFSRYYDNGDFMSKRRYSKREKYAIPYSGEEVLLHWANNDQYYIKTGEYFTDYRFKSRDISVHFKLQNAQVEQDNVKGDKRFFLPLHKEATYDEESKEIIIPFEYRPLSEQEQITYGTRNQQEKIIGDALEELPKRLEKKPEAQAALLAENRKTADGKSVSYLEHHLRRYTRRNTSDFFIHKDLEGFLKRELDFYLKNEVLNLDELDAGGEERTEGWFQIMRIIKAVGHKIIAFVAQIENFQKKLFEKKKFVTETEYCIRLGCIPEGFYTEIAKNKEQIEEWKRLFSLDKEQLKQVTKGKKKKKLEFLKGHPTLVIDTKHFDQAFKDRLLGFFDDLELKIDGLLIKGENFQVLNLMKEKFREKFKCIYIDPPYNTGNDEFLYKDNYQHSSWLAMIDGCIKVAYELLSDDGILMTNIDDNELYRFQPILSQIFSEKNYVGTFVVQSNPRGRHLEVHIATSH